MASRSRSSSSIVVPAGAIAWSVNENLPSYSRKSSLISHDSSEDAWSRTRLATYLHVVMVRTLSSLAAAVTELAQAFPRLNIIRLRNVLEFRLEV